MHGRLLCTCEVPHERQAHVRCSCDCTLFYHACLPAPLPSAQTGHSHHTPDPSTLHYDAKYLSDKEQARRMLESYDRELDAITGNLVSRAAVFIPCSSSQTCSAVPVHGLIQRVPLSSVLHQVRSANVTCIQCTCLSRMYKVCTALCSS
jgi:hypothetical protein